MLCFVILNSILFNLLCAWIQKLYIQNLVLKCPVDFILNSETQFHEWWLNGPAAQSDIKCPSWSVVHTTFFGGDSSFTTNRKFGLLYLQHPQEQWHYIRKLVPPKTTFLTNVFVLHQNPLKIKMAGTSILSDGSFKTIKWQWNRTVWIWESLFQRNLHWHRVPLSM